MRNWVERLTARCRSLEAAGYLLPADGERIIARQRERVAPLFEEIPSKEKVAHDKANSPAD